MDLETIPTPETEVFAGEKKQVAALDAIHMLTSQHRDVEALFIELEQTGERAFRTKERLLNSIIDKLQLHTALEEEIFYPGVKRINSGKVLEFFEEHGNIKAMIKKLGEINAEDATFDAKTHVLKQLVTSHVKEEEAILFPEVREKIDQELIAQLGERMQERTERGAKGGTGRRRGEDKSKGRAHPQHH